VREDAGEVRYTRSGAEFRITSVAEILDGVDPAEWWQTCPDCPTPVQGGPPALVAHRRRVHEDELRPRL
jgi:hypothetical protein